ncbi:MAG: hypothetical protein QM537_05035 [Candidatus Symbiobacter sp.]|nr:hypothetical protein [Candidatus Symbiobacter sp.]
MPRKQKKTETGLLNKGFVRSDNDHHYFRYYTIDGRKTDILTKTSHGGKDIQDDILSLMARQCKLSRKEFLDLIDCPLSREQYEKILTDKGFLNSN